MNEAADRARVRASALANNAIAVIHHLAKEKRNSWCRLARHQRQWEGWWKAEIVLALETWARSRKRSPGYGVAAEQKPRAYALSQSRASTDILLAPWDNKLGRLSMTAAPRVWLELKSRGTWWGPAAKALGTANAGLAKDLAKWDNVPWTPGDLVLCCHLTTHDGSGGLQLPKDWQEQLDEGVPTRPRYCRRRRVMATIDDDHPMLLYIDVFAIYQA